MFGGTTSTEYDDIVNKTTDENLTSENWELILNLCDKVQDEGQPGAHAAIAAILKRLAHRNPNVQLYALSLTESLSKNLGIEIHRELASRAFTQGLEKLITDRNTHEKVRRRALGLIALWTAEFEKDETLGIMEDCYNNLKAKNYKFEQPQEAPPPAVDDDIRRKEEEELQRVLEMSMQDKGGRNQWSQYSLASGSSSSAAAPTTATTSVPSGSSSTHPFSAPKYSGGGYVPARTPSPATVAAQQRQQAQHYHEAQVKSAAASTAVPTIAESSTPTLSTAPVASAAAPAASGSAMAASGNIVTRVRALHTFEPTEPGELAFEKGDVIKVVDRGYKDWWRGQLKGRTGIFPVNYVEAMPEPTASELAKEAEQEAAVFAQAVNVEKLLNMLRAMDPAKDNLADNEEIQELYRSSMALRPKIVKLIDKYSQKRADLVSMNETFVRARTIFDRMMEESLARHTGVYDQPTFRVPQYGQQGRPDSRGAQAGNRRPEYGSSNQPPQGYGWNNPAAGAYEQPGYAAYPQPNAYGGMPGGQQPGQEMAAGPYPTAGGTPGQPGLGTQQQPQQGYVDPTGYPGSAMSPQGQSGQPQQQQVPGGYGVVPQGGYAGHQPGAPYTQQGPTPYPVQQQPVQQQPVQQPGQQQPQQQPIQQLPQQPTQHIQPQPVQQQYPLQPQLETQASSSPNSTVSPQIQPQLQQQQQQQPQVQIQSNAEPQQQQPQPQAPAPQQPINGPPPYVYDPSYTYADPNVQAWAQYYAQGGKDLAGSVYFISIPGVTDAPPVSPQPQPEGYGTQQQQPQQGLGRQQSLQAHAQPQPQTQAIESDHAYGAGSSGSLRAASPAQQQQQQQQPISYQLHDQTIPQTQVQPQYASQYQPALDGTPKQASPSSPSYGAGNATAAGHGPGTSPTQSSSVPSWVLPKKTGPPTGGAGAVDGRDDSYFPVGGQMARLTLTDPGPGSAVSG